jgi:hypothetical protein
MCHARDWKMFDERAQKKAEETERRAGVIDRLLNDALEQGEQTKPEAAPAKEPAPAK